MRVIVLSLPNGSKEYLITNITDSSFTSEEFGKIYKMRWEIETKYDDLKNKLQIENFSGTSDIVIKQDFYSTMLLSNLVQSIIYDNGDEIEALHSSDDNKYSYAMNIAMTISELKTNFVKELLNNPPSASAGKFVLILSHFFLQYTKYSCEKVPSS